MKKVLLGIAVALCTMIMCLGFAACGSGPEGSYRTVSIIVEGNEYGIDDVIPAGEVFERSYTVHSDELVITIGEKGEESGRFSYTRRFGGGVDSSGGFWKEEDGEITFSFNSGDGFKMEYDGKDGLTVTQQLSISGKGSTQVTYNLKKEK